MADSKKIYWGVGFLVGMGLLFIYGLIDPSQVSYFPKCPFKYLSGFDCAGCGSQRALHQLIHLNIPAAFKFNPLLVISIPYMVLGAIIDVIPNPGQSLLAIRKRFYGTKAMYIVLSIIILFWIFRNF